MEPTIHPLLSLVEENRNGLKSALTHHINDTVDYQFDQLKNTLLKMILKGLINPLYEDTEENDKFTPFTQTNSPTYQANFDHEILPSILHHSNDHLTYEQHILTESAEVPENALKSTQPNAATQVNSTNNEQCLLISVNDNADTDAEVDMQIGFGHDEIEQDQQNASHDLMVISDVIDDDTNQSDSNTNDLSILINESEQICSKQKANATTKQQNGQSAQPVNSEHIQQSIPSTSTGLRSSDRKRIQRKLFGDVVRSNYENEMEDYKRKSATQSSKKVKNVKHLEEEVEEEEEDDKEVEDKFQVVTLEVNCTETGCKRILTNLEMWKQHLSNFHGKIPYKHLRDNVRLTQHGQTEYPCTECAVAPKSKDLLYQHWRMYHLAGKFQCSVCEFVANFFHKVRNHYQKKHVSSKFQCTQEGCNQTFKFKNNFVNHKRIHTGETPYKCTWDNCQVSFNQSGAAIRHVRMKHFRLPRTVREQKELNIIDERDAKVYIQVSRG